MHSGIRFRYAKYIILHQHVMFTHIFFVAAGTTDGPALSVFYQVFDSSTISTFSHSLTYNMYRIQRMVIHFGIL